MKRRKFNPFNEVEERDLRISRKREIKEGYNVRRKRRWEKKREKRKQ